MRMGDQRKDREIMEVGKPSKKQSRRSRRHWIYHLEEIRRNRGKTLMKILAAYRKSWNNWVEEDTVT